MSEAINGTATRVLASSEDVTVGVLAAVDDCLDWFADERRLSTEDFIDRLCDTYGRDGGWDIEDYSTAAVRKIMRYAREARS